MIDPYLDDPSISQVVARVVIKFLRIGWMMNKKLCVLRASAFFAFIDRSMERKP